jgi:predicted RNA-binding Zn ribbon-like protein
MTFEERDREVAVLNESDLQVQKPDPTKVDLLGGRLCLDFVNTGASGTDTDYLGTYSDLVAWSRHVGVLEEEEAGRLLREGARLPVEAAAVLERALGLREAIYRIFTRLIRGQRPQAADIEVLNRELSRATARRRIVPAGEGFDWTWSAEQELDRMLWPVVESAAELLTTEDLDRVHECAGESCGWLFLDVSKNRSRRWCDMQSCGNRAKVRRHYERKRRASGGRVRGARQA